MLSTKISFLPIFLCYYEITTSKIQEGREKVISTNTENTYESVSKETFDAHMQRIDQRFEMQDKLTAERLARMQAELGQSMERLVGVVNAMNARLDTIQQQYSWKIGWLGTVFTFCGAALAVYPLLSQYLTPQWIMAIFGIGGLGILLLSLRRK